MMRDHRRFRSVQAVWGKRAKETTSEQSLKMRMLEFLSSFL